MFKSNMRVRFASLAVLVMLMSLLLAACGDSTTASSPAAATSPAAAATTSVAATTAAATTAATTVAATTAATTKPATTAATTVAATSAATTTTAAASSTTAAASTGGKKISLDKLRFALIPAENATKVIADTQPFADALSKELGVPVELFVGTNYSATIEAMSSGKADVALFGPFSYVLAADKYNAEAVLLQLGADGGTTYNSYIITTPKTGIKTVAELKGRTFSFVDPASTSGNLVPRYNLVKAGFDPDKDLQAVYAGGHDASLLGVLGGKTDAGAVASDVFDKLKADGKFTDSDIVILQKSDPIPNSPIAVRKELSDSDKAAIKAAFLAVKDPAALKALNVKGYKDGSNDLYNGLRDIAKTLNLDLTKLK